MASVQTASLKAKIMPRRSLETLSEDPGIQELVGIPQTASADDISFLLGQCRSKPVGPVSV